GTDLDAATLHVGLSGLIDPSDDRFVATVFAPEAELRSGATVYRYHRDDGLPGTEGGFHLCAAWLLEAYLLSDQRSQPRRCSTGWSPRPGRRGCCPRSTTRWPNVHWATIRRPTATSGCCA